MISRRKKKEPAHWTPAGWEEKGNVLYDQIEIAVDRIGPDEAAEVAEKAIALVEREIRERTEPVTLAVLKQAWESLDTERERLDREMEELVKEDLEYRVFLHQSDRFTEPADIAKTKEARAQVARQFERLYQERERTAIAAHAALLRYRDAERAVEAAHKNLAWLESDEFKRLKLDVPLGDIARQKKRYRAILQKHGVASS